MFLFSYLSVSRLFHRTIIIIALFSSSVVAVDNELEKLKEIVSDFKDIMVLSIENIGFSGQKFYEGSYKLINQINNLDNRKQFNLHIDGGVNKQNIKSIKAQYIVSGSAVLNNENPRNAIMVLKTFGKYFR